MKISGAATGSTAAGASGPMPSIITRTVDPLGAEPGEAGADPEFELLEQAWPYDYENRSNVVEVYVRYLREKIDRPFHRRSLETVRGVGYRLCAT